LAVLNGGGGDVGEVMRKGLVLRPSCWRSCVAGKTADRGLQLSRREGEAGDNLRLRPQMVFGVVREVTLLKRLPMVPMGFE